ncbi:MAG: hypothetical protein ABIA47_02765 [bacterium]
MSDGVITEVKFRDGVVPAQPVGINSNADSPIGGVNCFHPHVEVDYIEVDGTLCLYAQEGGMRVDLEGVSCEALLREAIAAEAIVRPKGTWYGVFRPMFQKFLRHFVEAKPIGTGLLHCALVQLGVEPGGAVKFPERGYMGVFVSDGKEGEQLACLSTLISGPEHDARFNIVVPTSEILYVLTQAGYLRRVSTMHGMLYVELPDASLWAA